MGIPAGVLGWINCRVGRPHGWVYHLSLLGSFSPFRLIAWRLASVFGRVLGWYLG